MVCAAETAARGMEEDILDLSLEEDLETLQNPHRSKISMQRSPQMKIEEALAAMVGEARWARLKVMVGTWTLLNQ